MFHVAILSLHQIKSILWSICIRRCGLGYKRHVMHHCSTINFTLLNLSLRFQNNLVYFSSSSGWGLQYVIPPPPSPNTPFDNLSYTCGLILLPLPVSKNCPLQIPFGPRFIFCSRQTCLGGKILCLNKSCLLGSDSHEIERSRCCFHRLHCST